MKKITLNWISSVLLLINVKTIYAAIIMGNPLGSITLVELYDYQCPHCRAMQPVIQQLITTNPELRVVLRTMPAFGSPSWEEACLALAARYQHKFALFHNALMQLTFSPTTDQVLRVAQNNGLNIKQLENDSQRPSIINALHANTEAFAATGATGIPVLLIGATKGNTVAAEFVGETAYSILQVAIHRLTQSPFLKEKIP